MRDRTQLSRCDTSGRPKASFGPRRTQISNLGPSNRLDMGFLALLADRASRNPRGVPLRRVPWGTRIPDLLNADLIPRKSKPPRESLASAHRGILSFYDKVKYRRLPPLVRDSHGVYSRNECDRDRWHGRILAINYRWIQ